MPELTINVRIAESGDLDATAQRIGQKISGAASRGGGSAGGSGGSRRNAIRIAGLDPVEVEREGNQVVSSVTRSAERIARAQNAAFGVINVSSARVRQALRSGGGGSGGGLVGAESGVIRDVLRSAGLPFGTARGLAGLGAGVGGAGMLAVGAAAAVVATAAYAYNRNEEFQKQQRETLPDIGRLGLGSSALMGNASRVAALHGDIRSSGSALAFLGVPGLNLPAEDQAQARAALLGGARASGSAATEAQLADITGNIDLERRKRGKTPEEVAGEIGKDVGGIPLDRRAEATVLESRAKAESASGNYGAASRDQRSFNALVASQSERISNVKVAGEYTKQADAAELENLASERQSGQKLNELRVGLAAQVQGAQAESIHDPLQRAAQEQSDIVKQRDAKLINLKGDYRSALDSVKDASNQQEKYQGQWDALMDKTRETMKGEAGREGTTPTDNEVASRIKSLPEGATLFQQLTGAGLNVAQAQSAADKIKNNQPAQIAGITEAAQAQIDTIAIRAQTEERDRLFASTSRGIELEAASLPVAQQRIAAQKNLSRELSESRISQNLYNQELENTNTEFDIAQRKETAGNISAVGSSVLAERAAAFNFPGRTRAEQFSEQNFDLSVSSGFLTKQMENAGPLEKARLGLQRGTLQAQAGALGQGNLLAVGQSVDAGGNPLIEEANAIRNRRNQANRGAQFLEGLRNAPAYNDPDFNQARANLLGGGGGGMDQGLNNATAALAAFTAMLVVASKAPYPSGGGGSTLGMANK